MPSVKRPLLHHIALTVTDLDASVRWYEESPIANEPYASVLVFRDQDNIQLEFRAPAIR